MTNLRTTAAQLEAKLDSVPGDLETRLVLSDVYEDLGERKRAWFLRWSVRHQRWPMERTKGYRFYYNYDHSPQRWAWWVSTNNWHHVVPWCVDEKFKGDSSITWNKYLRASRLLCEQTLTAHLLRLYRQGWDIEAVWSRKADSADGDYYYPVQNHWPVSPELQLARVPEPPPIRRNHVRAV